jgi:hypothetical protein
LKLMRALLVLVLLAAPARAESWASTMGSLLKSATRLEVIHVGTITGTTISGNLVEAIRSPSRPGAVVQVDLANLVKPVVGDEVLVVCDTMCPRAAGIDDHGVFKLHAQELMDGATVTPDLVERASLVALAAGKPVRDLCFTGTLALLDERVAAAFSVTASAADGRGRGKLDGTKVSAYFWHPLGDTGIGLVVSNVFLTSPLVTRVADHCIALAATPTHPLVRTHRSLAAAMAGQHIETVFARGTWTAPDGGPIASGRHTIELSADRDGEIVLASDLARGHFSMRDLSPGHVGLGFPAGNDNYPMLVVELAEPAEPTEISGAVAALVAPKGATAALSWSLWDGTTIVTTPIGKVDLKYVPETATGRR